MAPIENDLISVYIGNASHPYRRPGRRQEAVNPEDISCRAREGVKRIDCLVEQIFDGWSQKTSLTAPRYIAELAATTRDWLAKSGENNILGLVRIVWQIGMRREDYWVPYLLFLDKRTGEGEEIVLGREGEAYRATGLPIGGIVNRELTTWRESDDVSAPPRRRALSIADEEIFVEPVKLGKTSSSKGQSSEMVTAAGLRRFIEFGDPEYLFEEKAYHAKPCFVDTEITKVLGEMVALYYPRETLWGVASLDPKSAKGESREISLDFDENGRRKLTIGGEVGPRLVLQTQQSLISLLAEAEAGLKTMYGQFLSP